jgi:hypothetical protein
LTPRNTEDFHRANRFTYLFSGTPEPGVVTLFAKVTFASGVSTLVTPFCKDITSMTKTGTGAYTIVLDGRYQRVLGYSVGWIRASSVPAAPFMHIAVDDTATDGNIDVVFTDADTPAATDPGDDDTLLLSLVLSNSSATGTA